MSKWLRRNGPEWRVVPSRSPWVDDGNAYRTMLLPPEDAIPFSLSLVGEEPSYRHCFIFDERTEPVTFISATGRLSKAEPARKASVFAVVEAHVNLDSMAMDTAVRAFSHGNERETTRYYEDLLEHLLIPSERRFRDAAISDWARIRMLPGKNWRTEALSFSGVEHTYFKSDRGWASDGPGRRTNLQLDVCPDPLLVSPRRFEKKDGPRQPLTAEQFTTIWTGFRMPSSIIHATDP